MNAYVETIRDLQQVLEPKQASLKSRRSTPLALKAEHAGGANNFASPKMLSFLLQNRTLSTEVFAVEPSHNLVLVKCRHVVELISFTSVCDCSKNTQHYECRCACRRFDNFSYQHVLPQSLMRRPPWRTVKSKLTTASSTLLSLTHALAVRILTSLSVLTTSRFWYACLCGGSVCDVLRSFRTARRGLILVSRELIFLAWRHCSL